MPQVDAGTPAPGPMARPFVLAEGLRLARCRHVEASVARVFGIQHQALRAANRGPAGVARARQIAMYLCHTSLGCSLTEVGRLFDRDRTTVSHACKLIEDMRDDRAFDALVSCLERAVRDPLAMVAGRSPARPSGEQCFMQGEGA